HLARMAAATLVPLVALTVVVLAMVLNAEREAARRGVRETARAVALAVDQELASAEAALRGLASSASLASDDLPRFYEQAMHARTTGDAWILMFDSDGRQIVNTRYPLGTPLARRANPERVTEVLATGRSSVSNLYVGALTKRYILTVDVP